MIRRGLLALVSKMRFLLPFLLLTLFVFPRADADSLPPPVVPECVGVNIHFTGAPPQDLEGLHAGGFGWVRMDFAWESIEKEKGSYDFTAYDTLREGLTKRGIKPLFILDYGNRLYQDSSPRSPEARAAFARFAAAAAAHYRGKPILWEIWNEPNIGFWKPAPNVQEYTALALATAQAIKKADPNATVLAPGTSGIPLDFLESAFQGGLLKFIDAVSLHPYRGNNPETSVSELRAVRQLIHHYAPPGKTIPLVSSEWGYSTVNVSEDTQAQYLARTWLSNLAEGVRLSIWYDWHDDGPDPKDAEHHFGTVRTDYTPKPAFLAAQALTAALSGFRFVKRLPSTSKDDYLLLFSKGNAVKLAVWTTGAAHEAVLADGRKLTLTGMPQYLQGGSAALAQAASWTAAGTGEFSSGGQPLRWKATYTNRDTRPHRIRFLPEVLAPARKSVPPGEFVTVKPGQTATQTLTLPAPARIPVDMRVGLMQDGAVQPYRQDVSWSPLDPLQLSVAPLTSDDLEVTIDNPAGTKFVGKLGVASGKPGALPVRLAAGQKTAVFSVKGAADQASAVVLRDEAGRLIVHQPLLRFVPYPDPLSTLTANLDGDLKVLSFAQAKMSETDTTPTLKVAYAFARGWSFLRLSNPLPAALPGEPVGLGVWVRGDGSGNLVRMRFADASGQVFQPAGPDMTWTGWRFVAFRLPSPDKPGSVSGWGGAGDGRVHYPVRVDTLLLLDSRADAPRHAGMIAVRQPFVLYERAKSR